MIAVGFDRKVISPVTLSDGTIIPQGETLTMPSGPMSRDEAYYTDAKRFDGNRFVHLIDTADNTGPRLMHEYVGIEPGNLSWGSGRFSCPGRWYASATIKMLLATFILEYDFKFPDGQISRPSETVMDVHVLPNMDQKILITKVT